METWKKRLLNWAIAAAIAIGMFCLIFFISANYSLIGWMNALMFAGIVTLGAIGLLYVYRWGAFDMIVYGIGDVFWHMNPSKDKIAKYDDYGDYREKKKEARERNKVFFWPYLIIGASCFAASIALRIVFYCQYGL